MEKLKQKKREFVEKRENFLLYAYKYFDSFNDTMNYDRKVDIIKELLQLFEDNIDIIFYKYTFFQDIMEWIIFRNMILKKCYEFKKKKELKTICNTFLQKYFSCQKITKKGTSCNNIILPIHKHTLITLEYMASLEKKEKNFSISSEEIQKLQSFRKDFSIELLCKKHRKD